MLASKAYGIDLSKVRDGWQYYEAQYVVHAENRNKAKSTLYRRITENYEQLLHVITKKEFTYIDLPVIRCPEYDLQEYKGQWLEKEEINRLKEEEKRTEELNKIEKDESIKFCYIRKRGSYYADNNCGYVSSSINAGVYTKYEALSEARYCDEISIVPINIPDHNYQIEKEINKLKARLL